MRWPSTSLSLLVLLLLLLTACGGGAATPSGPRPESRPADSKPAEPAKPTDGRPADGAKSPAAPAKPAEVVPAPAQSGRPAEAAKPAESKPAAAAKPADARPADAGRGAEEARPSNGGEPRRPLPTPPPPDSGVPCRNCPPPPPDRQPLRAGSVDDNQGFDEYLRYLQNYRGKPAWSVDVSERYLISVTDSSQRGVANATVRVYAGQTQVFEGRTYANGQTLFHPRANRDAIQATEFDVTVEKDGRFSNRRFQPGQGDTWTISLDGPALQRGQLVRIDLLILIDSTGSMGGEISKIQSTLSSIVSRISQLGGQPIIRYGGVTYRDRGDAYVTRKFNFSDDLQGFQGWLNSIRAGGGGDYPEALNEALHVAVSQMDWDRSDALRLAFLVADAPPHLDYQGDYRYTTEALNAVRKGIKLYTIGASGLDPQGEYVFRQLAQQTLAQYIFITRGGDEQTGGGPVSNTNIQSPENNLDDIIVRIVRLEMRAFLG